MEYKERKYIACIPNTLNTKAIHHQSQSESQPAHILHFSSRLFQSFDLSIVYPINIIQRSEQGRAFDVHKRERALRIRILGLLFFLFDSFSFHLFLQLHFVTSV